MQLGFMPSVSYTPIQRNRGFIVGPQMGSVGDGVCVCVCETNESIPGFWEGINAEGGKPHMFPTEGLYFPSVNTKKKLGLMIF